MAQISFRIDDDVKKEAEKTLDIIGLSMSTAMNIFLRKVAREKRIPFELAAETNETPNAETIAAIKEDQAMKANRSLGKSYTDIDAMMKELLN